MRFQPRTILLVSIFGNVFITLLFCFSVNREMALTLRVFTGMTQVWVLAHMALTL
jgi:hypothetical protein